MGHRNRKEQNMKVWINVNRQKAILAGKNKEGWELVEVDMGKLSQEEREYVAGCLEDWHRIEGKVIHAQQIGGSTGEPTEGEVIRCIQGQIEAQKAKNLMKIEAGKKEAEEKEIKIVALLDADAATLITENWKFAEKRSLAYKITGSERVSVYDVLRAYEDTRLDGKYAEAEVIAAQKTREAQEELDRKIAAYEAMQAEELVGKQRKENEKKEQIKKWVAEKGTENQRKRHEIKLLPESEVIDAIRDEAYRALDGFARYEKMQASDVCTCEEHYNNEGELTECEVDYNVSKASEATAEEYEGLEKIATAAKKAHPDAIVTMMDHVGTSEACENEVIRKSAKVEITVGAFGFSREYAI